MKRIFLSFLLGLLLITPTTQVRSQVVINSHVMSTLQPETKEFLAMAAITDATITSAIDAFIVGMKTDGLWTKTKAFWPIVGGTADTHKWNLKDPRDLDAAFRLTFSGTVTHGSTGMTGNGSTGFANTFLNANTEYPSGFMSIGVYIGTNVNQTAADIGALSNTNRYLQIYSRFGDTFYGQVNTNNAITESIGNTNSIGWFFACRSASTTAYIQKNTTETTGFTTGTAVVNANIYIMAQNQSGTAAVFSSKRIQAAGVWDVLTTTEADNLANRVSTLQTALGR